MSREIATDRNSRAERSLGTERRARKSRAEKTGIDYSLLVVVAVLIGFGLVMLYSSSYYTASIKFNDAAWYLKKQIIATALSVVALVFFTVIDYRVWKRYTWIIYIISCLLVVAVLTPIGMEANGARRWLNFGVMTVQPAEIAKIAVILLMAAVLSSNIKKINGLVPMLIVFVIALVPTALVFLITDNFSSAIIIAAIGVIMLIVACKRNKGFIILMISLLVIALVALMLLGGFRATRILVWLDPEQYASEGGFQVLQGLYAIGSGGLFGKGLGQSVQKLGFVPEAQNDMIFTIICEELGLFGGIAVLILFAFMIWRFMVIANNTDDLFGALIVVGVMAHIAVQVILNVAVVTKTVPNTGITLPFISYGGSSVMFLMSEIGLVLSVSKHKRRKREEIRE